MAKAEPIGCQFQRQSGLTFLVDKSNDYSEQMEQTWYILVNWMAKRTGQKWGSTRYPRNKGG